MNHFPLILRSGSHYMMGFQTGRQGKSLLNRSIIRTKNKLERLNINEKNWIKFVYDCEDCFDRYSPQLLDELRGIADGSGQKYEDVLINSMGLEFTSYFSYMNDYSMKDEQSVYQKECTVFGVTGKGSFDGGTIVHQNADSKKDSLDFYVVMKSKPYGGKQFISSNQIGYLPYNGINEDGLCFGNNGVGMKMGNGGPGLPVERKIAIILENCTNIDNALDIYTADRGGYSGWQGVNSVIGDKNGGLVRVGITNKQFDVKDASDKGVIVSTNHFHEDSMSAINPERKEYLSTYLRYDRAKELLDENKGKIDLEMIRSFASDHKHGLHENSICRHGPNTWTFSSLESVSSKKDFHISYGNPCKNNWKSYSL
jgi:isopenicillin-N N-acyltransferase-like protein